MVYTLNRRKQKKQTYNGVDNSIAHTIICAVFIVAIISFFGVLIINKETEQPGYVLSNSNDVWQREFQKVEENRVGIIFDGVSTTEKEYDILRKACNDYIDTLESDTIVDVNVAVSEDTFVDNTESLDIFDLPKAMENTPEYYSTESDMVETGPVYFNDLIIIRYINDEGQLKVVAGQFNKDKSDVILLNQSDINTESVLGEVNDTENQELNAEDINSKQMSEAEYINTVSDCIVSLLKSRNSTEEQSAISKLLAYFTSDGKNAMTKSKEAISLNTSSDVEMIFGAAGKSDTSKTIKDRIYLRYKITDYSGESYVNLIIKLNNYLRIFDIDMI